MSEGRTFHFIVLPIIFLFAPVLFCGKIFLDGDTVSYTYPLAYFFKEYAGVAWNPFILGGFPVTPLFHFGFFHPVYQLTYRFFDFLTAYHFLLLGGVLLSSFTTYLFARAQGVSKEGSIVAATAYTFSQWSIAWIASTNLINALYLLPILFLSVQKISEGKRWYALLFGGALGLAFLGTHYQFIIFAVGSSLAYFVWLMHSQWRNLPDISRIRASSTLTVAGLIMGVIIGASQLLATAIFFTFSNRSESYVFTSPHILSFLSYLLPNFSLPYIAESAEFYPYVGLIALFLGLVGLGYFRQNKHAAFFVGLFLFSILVMLPYSPLFWIIRHMPIMDHFGMAARWTYLANFALAMLAGFGFDILTHEKTFNFSLMKVWIRRSLLFLFSVVAILNVVYITLGDKISGLMQAYFDRALYAKTIGQPLAYYHSLIETLLDKVFFNVNLQNPQLILLAGSLFYLYILVRAYTLDKLSKEKFSTLLVFGVIANSLLFAIPSLTLADKQVILDKPQAVRYLETLEPRPFNFRVYSFMVPFALYEKITALHPEALVAASNFMREGLVPNMNMYFEVSVAGGYEPLATKKMQDLLSEVDSPAEQSTIAERIRNFENNLTILSRLSVKYIVSPYPLTDVRLKLLETFKVTEYKIPLYLYLNTTVLPRFSLSTTDVSGSLQILVHRPDEEVILVYTGTDTPLVRSEAFLPGWRATVDGTEVTITATSSVLQSVNIPKGSHRVRFYFRQKLYNIIQ